MHRGPLNHFRVCVTNAKRRSFPSAFLSLYQHTFAHWHAASAACPLQDPVTCEHALLVGVFNMTAEKQSEVDLARVKADLQKYVSHFVYLCISYICVELEVLVVCCTAGGC